MSFSFSSLIRLLVLLAVGTTMVALGVSRLDPPRPGWRVRRPASHVNVNEYYLDVADRTPRWLDAETGQVAAYPLEDGSVLESATCSPWVDENGQRQVAGRWASRTKDGPMSMSNDFGLARYTFPGGKLVDQVSTDIVPAGVPCWYPGMTARILFAAGDGLLYHFAFEPEPWVKASDPEAKGDLKPRLMSWKCSSPGAGSVFIGDLSWPEDPRLGGCVVVSLREKKLGREGAQSFSRTQIWWLKLNFAGTEVVDCGRLISPDGLPEDQDERSPTVSALPDGRLAVAYLTQRSGSKTWVLRAAPISFDSDRRGPRAHASESLPLGDRCQPAHPSLSSDGRWINAISGQCPSESRVTRFSTSKLTRPSI